MIGGFCKGFYLIGLKNTVILSLCHLMTAKAGESAVLVINTMCSADREKVADIQYLPSLVGAMRLQLINTGCQGVHQPIHQGRFCDEGRCCVRLHLLQKIQGMSENTGGPVCPTKPG